MNKEDFKKYILSEVKKLAIEKGWIKEEDLPESDEVLFENIIPKVIEDKKQIIADSKEQTKEAKKLAEEIKRMKQLLDFRNPLLGEKL